MKLMKFSIDLNPFNQCEMTFGKLLNLSAKTPV